MAEGEVPSDRAQDSSLILFQTLGWRMRLSNEKRTWYACCMVDKNGRSRRQDKPPRCAISRLRFGTLSSESSGRVLFPLLCHGCARLCMRLCIGMMTFTASLCTRGAEVCRGFDSDGLALVLVLASLGRRWGLGLMFMIS